jgi:hypothetical protein
LRAPRKNEVVAVAPMIVDCATKIWSYSARERYHPFNTISSSPKTAQTTNHACLQRTAHQRKASHRSFQVVNNTRQETPPTETSLVSHRRNPEFLVRTPSRSKQDRWHYRAETTMNSWIMLVYGMCSLECWLPHTRDRYTI